MYADGGRSGKAGGFDAHGLKITGPGLADAEIVQLAVQVGAQAGEGGDHIAEGNVRYAQPCSVCCFGQAFGGGAGGFAVVDVLCGGADHQVAVDGGGHEYALAQLAGGLEDGCIHKGAGFAVQQLVFAAAGHDFKLVVAELVVQPGAVKTGAVDHGAGFIAAAGGLHAVSAFDGQDILHAGIEMEFRAVDAGIFCQRLGQLKGAHDACGGRMQRGGNLL